ncbi:MAG: MFS transporter, partial [Chloroflexota bacterium]
ILSENFGLGILVSALAFGAWGMGYNLSSVSYLALASELSDEKSRGKTIATMWFMMIVGIIVTAIGISRMVEPYSADALQRSFWTVGLFALALGLIALLGLEPRAADASPASENYTLRQMADAILSNRPATIFFFYLLLLLAAILGQDVLLEPFAAEAFGLTVQQTTRITSIWGGCVLLAILVAGALEGRLAKRLVAQVGNLGALAGFIVIVFSAFAGGLPLFYTGVMLLGLGTGLSTVANLSLMFDLTAPGKVGLFIGAWGFSNALSRLTGSVLGGVVRDVATQITQNAVIGYVVVFTIEALLLVVAASLIYRIDVSAFKIKAEAPSVVERAAMAD